MTAMLSISRRLLSFRRHYMGLHLQSRGLTSIAEAFASTPNGIAVLYGSHSGNSERLAKQLHAELKWRLGVSVLLGNTSNYSFHDLDQLKSSDLMLLLTSTYGDGGPNNNTHLLWDTVFDQNAPPLKLSYSVMSRGSSLYGNNFAMAGRKLDARFHELGGHRIAPVGIQDKISLDPDEEFFGWKEQVIQHLIQTRGFVEKPYDYEPVVEAVESTGTQDTPIDIFYQDADSTGLIPTEMPIEASRLASTDREYVFAKAHLPDGVSYRTGDYLLIWPENPENEREIFMDAMFGNSARRNCVLDVYNGFRWVKTSYELLVRHSIDINGRIERDLLLKLAKFAPNDEARQRTLELMGNKSKLQEVTMVQGNYNLARLLKWLSPEGPWIRNLPPSALFDVLPHLLPRRYSISSSSIEEPSSASLSAVVERDESTGFQGVATGQLSSLIGQPDQRVMAAIESLNSFRPPPDASLPLIMFAVGTGVAPFRGFIRERSLVGPDAAPTVLFAGSRTPEDLVHRQEFLDFESNPAFDFKLVPAYSRVKQDHADKGYIFEKLRENGDLVWELIQLGADIYICGDVRKIRRGIRDTLAEILAAKKGLPAERGQREFKKLKRAGRIRLDLW